MARDVIGDLRKYRKCRYDPDTGTIVTELTVRERDEYEYKLVHDRCRLDPSGINYCGAHRSPWTKGARACDMVNAYRRRTR